MMACPHGEHESYCMDCLEGVPAKVEPSAMPGVAVSTAVYEGKCARKGCAIALGDLIVYVEDRGWCCATCATRPPTMGLTKGST